LEGQRIAVMSFDVERDAPPYLSTYRGVEQGLPRILDLLDRLGIKATFFVTGNVALRYPDLVEEIVKRGHELGSHGFAHIRYDLVSPRAGAEDVEKSLDVLSSFSEITSFRAPNLQAPKWLFPLLYRLDVRCDSSTAIYKGAPPGIRRVGGVLEIPASVTSSVLRLPTLLQRLIYSLLPQPLVLFAHPWEFTDMRGRISRIDMWYNTGDTALRLLEWALEHLQNKGYRFVRLCEVDALMGRAPR